MKHFHYSKILRLCFVSMCLSCHISLYTILLSHIWSTTPRLQPPQRYLVQLNHLIIGSICTQHEINGHVGLRFVWMWQSEDCTPHLAWLHQTLTSVHAYELDLGFPTFLWACNPAAIIRKWLTHNPERWIKYCFRILWLFCSQ